MKVLHMVGGDLRGGAARGAYWLHQGLLALGVESRVLTNSRETFGDPTVFSVTRTAKGRLTNSIRARLDQLPVALYTNRKTDIFSCGFIGYNFLDHECYKWADVINLHWVNGGFVRVEDLRNVKKPMIWTLRDLWPMTGGCHIPMECVGYTSGCGSCPQLGSKDLYDLSSRIVDRKQRQYPSNIHVVGISRWITECALSSYLFRNRRCSTIPNNVNCNDFFQVSNERARSAFKLPTHKKVILAGAQKGNLVWKGLDHLISAIGQLDRTDCVLVLFGDIDPARLTGIRMPYLLLGTLTTNEQLRLAYSASDVFVSPSLMESFGKTIAEAMACGTPAVCFDSTGPRDIVVHGITGYKAVPYDTTDLARGIEWVLDQQNRNEMSAAARRHVEENFDTPVVAQMYIRLYQDVLA